MDIIVHGLMFSKTEHVNFSLIPLILTIVLGGWWGPSEDPSEGVFEIPLQYVSANNHDANYEITVELDGTDFCFGYILEEYAETAE